MQFDISLKKRPDDIKFIESIMAGCGEFIKNI